MYVNTHLLKKTIEDKNMTIEGVSKSMGINPSTFYRKLERQGKNFTVEQMQKIGAILALSKSDLCDIFLFDSSQ